MADTTESAYAHPRTRTGTVSSERLGPIQGVTEGASSVLNDAFDLAELQGKLLLADSKECLSVAKAAVMGLVVSLALLIAALPVVASGLAQGLSSGLEWPLWICQLAVGFIFTISGIVIGYMCVKRLRSSFIAFEASRIEISENLSWFRKALSRTFPS